MEQRIAESGSDVGRHGASRVPGKKAMPSRRGRQLTALAICLLAAFFSIWRIAVFVPQPLDSNATLRPFLCNLFSKLLAAFANPEQAFSAWYGFCAIFLLVPPMLAVLNYLRENASLSRLRIPRWLCSRALLFTSIGLCFVLCKYPTLLEPELNPDEGQFLASANKLFYDGNFFRADDCGTSGPVNIYPLMLPAIFGLSPDFASSRTITLLILLFCVWLLYATLRQLTTDEMARLAILPAAGAFAVFKNVGLVEYSSEDVPVLLACIGLYAAVRILADPVRYGWPLFVLGFASSAAFLAKLQAVPIMAGLTLVALAYVYVRRAADNVWIPAACFVAGVAPLQILNAALCLNAGVWHDFWMSYIVTNLYYADVQSRFVTDMPQLLAYLTAYDEIRIFLFTFAGISAAYLFERLRAPSSAVSSAFLQTMIASAVTISFLIFFYVSNLSAILTYLTLLLIATVPAYILLRWRELPFDQDPLRWFGLLAFVFTIVSMYSVYAAHRPFPHYLLFLFIPICTLTAWMLIRQAGHAVAGAKAIALAFVAVFVVLTVVGQAYLWGTQDDHVFTHVKQTIRAPEGDFIRSLTTPHGRITVWGWTVAPYLSSGHVPATRDTNMTYFFRWPAISAYDRARFLHDMRVNPPQLFIDATGPASFAMTDRRAYTFEHFPEIESYIMTFYVPVADRFDERYYLRRDMAARIPSLTSR